MPRLARLARAWALVALALVASLPPASAQEAAPDGAQPAPRSRPGVQGRAGQRIEMVREARAQLRREAPTGFDRWLRELRPVERRRLERHLLRMPAPQRERWFRQWSRLSLHERRELAASLAPLEARRRRELPPRLRTSEMRERLAAMSPEERREFIARVQDWREMRPAERRRMRARLERFGALGADEQQKLVDERFERRTPEERARILRELRAASAQLRSLREERAPRPPSAAEERSAPRSAPEAPAPP